MLSVVGKASTIVEAMQLGASDYINKPFEEEELQVTLDKVLEQKSLERQREMLSEELQRYRDGVVWASVPMQEIRTILEQVGETNVTVLIQGESGVGKEIVARTAHSVSNRSEHPFVKVNCAALPEDLLESELFGYEKGAFTGAARRKAGKFEHAHKGTIFLDEIGELPLGMQVKLLRVIQEKKVKPIGKNEEIPVDFRIMAATNRNLGSEVAADRFREDLFSRLAVAVIRLPPLRSRTGDLGLLIEHLLEDINAKSASEPDWVKKKLSASGKNLLLKHAWPGNIRELENRLKKAIVLSDGNFIGPEDLGLTADDLPEILPLNQAKEKFQRDYINEILALNNGNRTKTARCLGVGPRTIFRHLEKEESGPKSS